MDQDQLFVRHEIEINTDRKKVWEVLTSPEFIAQWDDLPESYKGGNLESGSVLEWEGYSKLTVVEYEPLTKLSLRMYLPKVELDPAAYNVCYTYQLSGENSTFLHIEVGDFSPLPYATNYYDATEEWAEEAKHKIKELAENN